MKAKHLLIFGLIICIGGVISLSSILPTSLPLYTNINNTTTPAVRGLCWVGGDSIADHNIQQIIDIGANWISQTPFGWMSSYDSPEVVLSSQRGWWGERDEGIAHTTEHAKKAGVKSMLKPHIWLRRGDGKWRSDIAMNSEEEWNAWFESYTAWIMHYATLAAKHDIEALCIGTELHQTIKRTEDWKKLIKNIKSVYDGELTYAANWYQEYEDVKFWDDLDYIGIQGYFPLSKKESPNKKDLIASWKKHKKKLKKIANQYNKKIVFTEIGYKNTTDAAKEPWTWPQDLNHQDITISNETQQVCYEALFESFWNEPWFDGLFIWKWFHSTHQYDNFEEYFQIRFERRKKWAKERGRVYNDQIHFSPQMTGTVATLEEWYRK